MNLANLEPPAGEQSSTALALLIGSVALLVWLFVRSRQRKVGFQTLARKLRFTYKYFGFKGRKRIFIFSDRRDWTITAKHLIRGTRDDVEIAVTDAAILETVVSDSKPTAFDSGRLEHDLGSSRYTTAILLQVPGLDLPRFKVHSRDKSEDFMIGNPGIKGFDDYQFENQHRVTGDDSERVIKSLSPDVQKLLMQNRRLTVVGDKNVILIFHYQRIMPFSEVERTIKYGLKLADVLREGS